MVSDPENNHGLMLQLVNEQYYRCMLFASGDCEILEKRPRLEIIYVGCIVPTVDFDYQLTGQSVCFTGISPTATEWRWDFGDGYYSNLQNPVHIYDTPENYQVCLTTWNECGADTTCEMLYISSVSVPENGEGAFMIYPNPAKDKVFLTSFLSGKIDISLTDLGGKVVYQEVKDVNYGELILINLDGLEPGIYIVRAGSGEVFAFGKLVILQ
jgi:PKD repeat protein